MGRYRTPLRYPGGKQRLAPFIAEILEDNDLVGGHYAEPYAGGAGVAMELLFDGVVSHVHLNDSSAHIFALWTGILEHTDEFCDRIRRASLCVEDWRVHREVVRHPTEHAMLDLGFSTFYLNRCNRSGIISGGVIGGLAQSGLWKMDARFSRIELARRVEAIARRASQISLSQLDAEDFLRGFEQGEHSRDSLVYCDPPYYEHAQRLYLDSYQADDHARLARFVQNELSLNWVVSYDGHPDVIELYGERRKFLYDLQYSAARSYKGQEVFIFSDDVSIPTRSKISSVNDALARLSCG